MILIGSKVRIKKTGLIGIVVGLEDSYLVDLSTSGLFVRTWFDLYEIEEVESNPGTCECGLNFVRCGGKHSDYCPMYKKEE